MAMVADIRVTVSTPMSTGAKVVIRQLNHMKVAITNCYGRAVVDTPPAAVAVAAAAAAAAAAAEHPPAPVATAYCPVPAIGTNVLVVSFVW